MIIISSARGVERGDKGWRTTTATLDWMNGTGGGGAGWLMVVQFTRKLRSEGVKFHLNFFLPPASLLLSQFLCVTPTTTGYEYVGRGLCAANSRLDKSG